MNQGLIQKIRDIQKSEGNNPCFKTGKLYCSYSDKCCWLDFCLDNIPEYQTNVRTNKTNVHLINVRDVEE